MTYRVITSYSPAGYKEYGRKCVETFRRFWPKEIELTAVEDVQEPTREEDQSDAQREADSFEYRFGQMPAAHGIKGK